MLDSWFLPLRIRQRCTFVSVIEQYNLKFDASLSWEVNRHTVQRSNSVFKGLQLWLTSGWRLRNHRSMPTMNHGPHRAWEGRRHCQTEHYATTHFEQLKQQSSLFALAQVSLSRVTKLAVKDNVHIGDWLKVIRVSSLHLHHIACHCQHNITSSRWPADKPSRRLSVEKFVHS